MNTTRSTPTAAGRHPALAHLLAGLGASAVLLVPSAAEARPPEGAYIGFGLGYALPSGDRGVPLAGNPITNLAAGSPQLQDVVRTDFGEGMSFELRFGWLIGPLAPEIGLVGHGSFDFANGAGYPTFTLRFHPMMLVDSVDLPVDFNVFVGAGYAIGGYHHEVGDDDKGWEGWNFSAGLAVSYDLSEKVRLALDLRFVLPQYTTFLYDWDDDIEFEPDGTPRTVVTIPSLQIIASF